MARSALGIGLKQNDSSEEIVGEFRLAELFTVIGGAATNPRSVYPAVGLTGVQIQ